ncbi:MAG: hypothetical protein ABI599_07780 [Flavobacteriales bacterium]
MRYFTQPLLLICCLLLMPAQYLAQQDTVTTKGDATENKGWEVALTGTSLASIASTAPDAFIPSASVGFGASFRNRESNSSFSLTYTISGTRDTITSVNTAEFGTAVLVPGIRKNSILISVRDPERFGGNHGWGAFLNYTNMDWTTNLVTLPSDTSSDGDTTLITRNVAPLTLELYYSWRIANIGNNGPDDTPAKLTWDLGLAFKYLAGERLSAKEADVFLGSHQELFPALHTGFSLHYGDMSAFGYFNYIFPCGDQPDVQGLTGLRFIGGIKLSANIAKIVTEKDPKETEGD